MKEQGVADSELLACPECKAPCSTTRRSQVEQRASPNKASAASRSPHGENADTPNKSQPGADMSSPEAEARSLRQGSLRDAVFGIHFHNA